MHWDDRSVLTNRDCDSTDEAVARVVREVACTWPSFHRRNLDWGRLCERYADRALDADEPTVVIERWLAELGDAHTSIRSTTLLMPPAFRARGVGEMALDAAFDESRGACRLIVDLRSNGGGNVNAARAFRDRFVRERSLMGYRQFSDPWGELGHREPSFAEPAPMKKRWMGPVRFLIDPLTYSASEDALLGLSGLGHVQIVGLESGGGSGQARIVRLQSGRRLTVSSCLTFDRHGNCIEGVGIPVDRRVPLPVDGTPWDEAVLSVADRDWS